VSEKVVKVEVTMEPRVYVPTTMTVEVPVSELDGKSPQEREKVLFGYAESLVSEYLTWGWEELPGEHDPEEQP
jgi:hypothetical protein